MIVSSNTGGMAGSQKLMYAIHEATKWCIPYSKLEIVEGNFEPEAMIEAAHEVIVNDATPIEYNDFPH